MEKVFVGSSYAVDLENYSAFALPDTCFCSEVSITVDVFVTLAWPSEAPAADVHSAVLAVDHDIQVAAAVLDPAVVAVLFGAVSVVFSAAVVVVAAIVDIDAALIVFQSVSHFADADPALAGEENSLAIAVEVAEQSGHPSVADSVIAVE